MVDTNQIVQLLSGTLSITFADRGEGAPLLVVHGGAGPQSVAGFVTALAGQHRVIAPVLPGFDGTNRPEWFSSIGDVASGYLALIEHLDLKDVIVIGNSVGGWIAAELALRHSPRIRGMVLLNSVGIDTGSPDEQIVDPTKVEPQQRASLAFHDPAKFAVAPSAEALVMMSRNQETLRVYAGEPFMHDPTLRERLAGIAVPSLVTWGVSDGIVSVEYGRRLADSIPGARFERIGEAGHFPQIEKLDMTVGLVTAFVRSIDAQPG